MSTLITASQHPKQILFTPIIVLDIDKHENTLFIGWIIWSVEFTFYKNPINK